MDLVAIVTAGMALMSAGAQASIGRADAAFDEDEPRLSARLVADAGAPGSREARVGVFFELDPGWHLYWRNPGDAGLPTRLDWEVEGAEVGPVAWPAPAAFSESEGELTTFGYAGEVLLASPLSLPDSSRRTRAVRVDVSALVCERQCIPARFRLESELGAMASVSESALFEHWARRVPSAAESLGLDVAVAYSQSAIRPGDDFSAALEVFPCGRHERQRDGQRCMALAPRNGPVAFFPEVLEGIELLSSQARAHPRAADAVLVTLSGHAESGEPAVAERLRGVLALRGAEGEPLAFEVDLPLPRAPRGAEVEVLGTPWLHAEPLARAAAGSLGLATALWLAFLGGLVLNLMPCVLPVLAIKVFAVAEMAHRSRRQVLLHALAYASGILLTMGILAGSVLALRAAGASVGWGFQFQEPLFVVGVSVVLVVFAMNLLGAFEIGVDTGRFAAIGDQATGARRSFFEGLLAVVLATPCSAPFLGTAVGFAFASSPARIVAIFLAIGLGLAAPFALVSLVPAWGRLVPRSGPWMLRLRAGLGFLLLGTIVWLVWILGQAAGVDAVVGLLALLLLVAFGSWAYGVLQHSERPWLPWTAVAALGAALLLGTRVLPLETGEIAPGAAAARGPLAASSWEPDVVRETLDAGRSAFVYFTADWCVTCKVNERMVLADDSVREEVEKLDVAVFRADWTRRDERIRAELARHGRAGVPLYLVHHPEDAENPIVLSELLTPESLIAALHPR